MNQTRLSWSTAPARSAGGACSSLLLTVLSSFLFALGAAAQAPRLVVSTTDDVAAAAGVPFSVLDGDLVTVQAGQPVAPFLAGGHFHAVTGFTPSDVDAYAHLPGSRPGSTTGNVYSLLSNEGGFLDGDLLIFANGGGVALLVSELDLATALGASGTSIDVDALAYDDTGRILFSLADNLVSSTLGSLSDGDILRLEPAFASVTLVLTESEVQARFTAATGLADAILDVQALEWAGGELWGAVQAPSRHDGSVIGLQGTPRIVADETVLGLGGAEIDALDALRQGDEIPVFHMSAELALPGDLVHIETRGRPGSTVLVLPAGNVGYVPFPRFAGFGAFYLAPLDPWLTLAGMAGLPRVQLDGNGRASADWRLPTAMVYGNGPAGELGWSFHVIDPVTREISAPFRIQKL